VAHAFTVFLQKVIDLEPEAIGKPFVFGNCQAGYELGPKNIRVHAVSPGPVKTRAASGIDRFDELLDKAAEKAP
jgi:hypothetical protein